MVDTIALGKRIQERRKAKGLTQEQLGASVGVTGQAVSRWENGDSAPDLGVIPDLCRFLEVSSDSLLGVIVEYRSKYKSVTVDSAMDIYRQTGTISVSLLQKKLMIGYREAKRLMEEVQKLQGEVDLCQH